MVFEQVYSCKKFKIWRLRGIFQNCYIVGDKYYFVVDCGVPSSAKGIKKFFVENKLDTDRLKLVVATHFHLDHTGGIKKLFESFNPYVAMHTMVRDYINKNIRQEFPPFHKFIKLYPLLKSIEWYNMTPEDLKILSLPGSPYRLKKDVNYLEYNVDFFLNHGDSLPFFNEWKIIHSPGHSMDSLVVLHKEKKILFTGDTILSFDGLDTINPFCLDEDMIKNSAKSLYKLKPSLILPGHGTPVFKKYS